MKQGIDIPETAKSDFLQKAPKTVQPDSKVNLSASLVAVVRLLPPSRAIPLSQKGGKTDHRQRGKPMAFVSVAQGRHDACSLWPLGKWQLLDSAIKEWNRRGGVHDLSPSSFPRL